MQLKAIKPKRVKFCKMAFLISLMALILENTRRVGELSEEGEVSVIVNPQNATLITSTKPVPGSKDSRLIHRLIKETYFYLS